MLESTTEDSDVRTVQFADGFDEAIIGIACNNFTKPVVVYDREKIIEILMRDGGTREECEEHFEFNVIGAYVGPQTPIYLTMPEWSAT